MTGDGHPPSWWDALDRHRAAEAEARHLTAQQLAGETGKLAERVNAIESWVDQLKGAQGLVKALIGTNILVAIATILALVAALK